MIIDQVNVWYVAMPLIKPWITGCGIEPEIHSVIVCMRSGRNEGWAESTPFRFPCYSPEWASGVFKLVTECFVPQIIGKDITSGTHLQDLLVHFKANQFAKAVLDNAWWNLHSSQTNTPLHRLLGGSDKPIEVGADFGVADSIDELIKQIGSAVDQNFARVKLKVKRGWDIEIIKTVRKKFPDLVFHVDCNSSYTLDDLEMFKKFDNYNLAMIEQPLAYDDLTDHAKLQAKIQTPICLDESLNSMERARKAIELGSANYFNIKPGRVGGLTVAKQIHDLADKANIPCWVGGMLESACGAETCIQLATLHNFKYAADIFPSEKFYTCDMSEPPIKLIRTENNRPAVEVPAKPGNNHIPNMDRLECLAIGHIQID
jgi:o-succinylbenzoate synthase